MRVFTPSRRNRRAFLRVRRKLRLVSRKPQRDALEEIPKRTVVEA
jgi:hypothetical protein